MLYCSQETKRQSKLTTKQTRPKPTKQTLKVRGSNETPRGGGKRSEARQRELVASGIEQLEIATATSTSVSAYGVVNVVCGFRSRGYTT